MSNAIVFAVFREGVFRHQCGGIFTTPYEAIEAAKSLMGKESDNYHSYDVVPFLINVVAVEEPDNEGLSFAPDEPEPIAHIYRLVSGEVAVDATII
jgi:hypothetical protein